MRLGVRPADIDADNGVGLTPVTQLDDNGAMIERITIHQKTIWMLNSFLKG